MGIRLVPDNINIDFIKKRFIFFGLSTFILVAALVMGLTKGINWGIDFKGGFMINMRMSNDMNINSLREKFTELKLGDVSFKEVGNTKDVMVTIEKQPGDENAQMTALTRIKEALGEGVEYRSIDTVGPKASEELLTNGTIAIILCLLAMLGYVAIRFQWRFGVCAIFSLIHDALFVMAFYVFTGLEFNMPAILAILITIGYSINDTVVIYDRIRENLAKFKKLEIPELINLSMNETLSRTTITSGTTLLSLIFLYFFGGEVIASYSLPILMGIIVGTFSSICLSGPLLVYFDIRALPKEVEGFKPGVNEN
ncbi:MAG: protein translocase subunit SecF [Candidatus Paracaedibacteraceae bacterium]|nr:protein translocase subunit SecF [Candidatus Paracaedibacteraceae bacterium]